MMPGVTAIQPEPHTWRGASAFTAGTHLSTMLLFGIGKMSITMGGRGSVVFQANNRLMSATFAGRGAIAWNARLTLKASAAFVGAGTIPTNGTIV